MNKSINLKNKSLVLVSIFVVVLLLNGYIRIGLAQEWKIDINALIGETQKMSPKPDDLTMVWWIAEEFWWASFAQDPSITEVRAEQFIKVLRPYTVFVIINGKIGPLGGATYRSKTDIRASIRFIDRQGTRYFPLNEDKIDADTKNLLSMMKPMMVNLLGPMGQNMHFLLFPAKNKRGQSIAEATKEGAFSVKLGEREFRWRLPLGAVLPPKICTTCGEKLSGAYKFCPWDGTKLPKTKK